MSGIIVDYSLFFFFLFFLTLFVLCILYCNYISDRYHCLFDVRGGLSRQNGRELSVIVMKASRDYSNRRLLLERMKDTYLCMDLLNKHLLVITRRTKNSGTLFIVDFIVRSTIDAGKGSHSEFCATLQCNLTLWCALWKIKIDVTSCDFGDIGDRMKIKNMEIFLLVLANNKISSSDIDEIDEKSRKMHDLSWKTTIKKISIGE